ncbi:MAG TPA: hypothetical protein VGR76_15920 [Candidatus Angelobacter sp.]|nr:hypothetical protein [Candidatus Angelobacter sp.]
MYRSERLLAPLTDPVADAALHSVDRTAERIYAHRHDAGAREP